VNHLFIKGAVHSHQFSTAQIEGTAGKYEKEFQKLKEKKKNDALRIVGWWHSHPGFTCFLSTVDVATQEFFFPESYQSALVVDPVNKDFKFFTLDNGIKKGYKELSYAIISHK
jgi:proteasome lid subunit RPN8/RPN11